MLWDGPRAPRYAPMKKQAQLCTAALQLGTAALHHSSAPQLGSTARQHSSAPQLCTAEQLCSAALHRCAAACRCTPLLPPSLTHTLDSPPRPAPHPPLRPRCQGAIILGIGGDNSAGAVGTFYEGAMLRGYTSDATDDAMQANIVAAGYGK